MMTQEELTIKMELLAGLMTALKEQEEAFEQRTADLRNLIEQGKEDLKAEFLRRKESLDSEHLTIKYRKGAVRWDTQGLRVYAKDHPELDAFRKEGEPTIAFSLRKPEEEDETSVN